MSNEKNSDPLERLFKRKLKDHTIPYDKKNWQKLEQRLNNADAIYGRRRNRRLIAAAFVLLLCVMAYFTMENRTMLNRLSEQLNEAMVSQSQKETATENGAGPQQHESNERDESTVSAGEDNRSRRRTNRNPVAAPSERELPVTVSDAPSVKERRGKRQQGFDWAVRREAANGLFISELACPACALSALENEQSNIAVDKDAYYTGIENSSGVDATAQRPSRITHEKANTHVHARPRLSLGLVMGPDFSTAGALSHFENPGVKIGGMAELRLTSHLAVRTGFIHSNVRYNARGRDYTPPQGYWTDGIAASETFAECSLIDIPLSLKYDLLQFDRSGVFVTAGFSSYIMLSEAYYFSYGSDAPGLKQQWSDNTGTRHWFSNASFSAGYEWDIHPNWGIQVEPFINVPISGVGWGDVELYSVGSFVSFSYKIGSVR